MKVEMKNQLNEATDMFISYEWETITESVTSPAQQHLCIVNEKCEDLIGKKCELFHTVIAMILYITK